MGFFNKKRGTTGGSTTTNNSGNLTYTESVMNQVYQASKGKTSSDGSGANVTNGQGILSITGKTGGLGGHMIYTDTSEASFSQSIATRIGGGLPKFYNTDGGFLHLANGMNIKYANTTAFNQSISGEFMYVFRIHTGKRYEAIISCAGAGVELKRLQSGMTRFKTNTWTGSDNDFSYDFPEFMTILLDVRLNGTNATIYVYSTNLSSPQLIYSGNAVNTSDIINELSWGTSSHPASTDHFCSAYKFSALLSSTERSNVVTELASVYPIGQYPSKVYCKPTVGYSSNTFTVTPNFQGTVDLSQCTVRWFMLDSPGDALAQQSLLKTSNATDLSLNLSSYPQFQTGVSGDEIVCSILCKNSSGIGFEIDCASDPIRYI